MKTPNHTYHPKALGAPTLAAATAASRSCLRPCLTPCAPSASSFAGGARALARFNVRKARDNSLSYLLAFWESKRRERRAPLTLAVVAALTAALVITGCTKPEAKAPEKSLVRTAFVEAAGTGRSDSEAAYLAAVKFDRETDLNFKVGGIVVLIGPAANADWDEATPVKTGALLAELKQSDFENALSAARAKADLADTTRERFRKLRVTDAISQQELDVIEAEWRTAQAALDQAQQNLRDSRLRPVLMTVLAVFGGLVPLFFAGGALWHPLTAVHIFGLLFAPVLTLGMLPTM